MPVYVTKEAEYSSRRVGSVDAIEINREGCEGLYAVLGFLGPGKFDIKNPDGTNHFYLIDADQTKPRRYVPPEELPRYLEREPRQGLQIVLRKILYDGKPAPFVSLNGIILTSEIREVIKEASEKQIALAR